MTLSGDSEQNQYLQDLVGFEGDNLKIAVEPASDSTHSDNTGNISLADFHSAPKFNKLIFGGVIALSCTFLGFFFFNRSPVNSETSASNEKPTEKESPLLEKSSQDSRVGQLKTEVALSDQQQALKEQKIEPPSPRSPRSLTQAQSPRSTSASPSPTERRAQTVSRSIPPVPPVRTLENNSPPSYVPPPRVPFRPVERRVVRYVPPPLSIRRMPGSTVASLSHKTSGATSTRPLSYQFGVPSSATIGNKGLQPSRQAEIPPNYQVYYPNKGTDAANTGTDADSDLSPPSNQIASSVPAAKLVNATSPVALSPAEQRFLEGRPMMRSIPVGTQIFAQIFQATAVDNAQGYKVLVRVSTDAQGNQSIPAGTLIGATLQIGAGGVARVTPEVFISKIEPFPFRLIA